MSPIRELPFCAIYTGEESSFCRWLYQASAADVNCICETGETALFLMSKLGREKVVKKLLAHPYINVNWKNKCARTALMESVRNGHFKTVEALLTHQQIIINSEDENGYTALMHASEKCDVEIVLTLIDHSRKDETVQKKYYSQALMVASAKGHTKIVEVLLEKSRLDINMQDESGFTALMRASMEGYVEIVKLLQADPEIDIALQNKAGKTASDLTKTRHTAQGKSWMGFMRSFFGFGAERSAKIGTATAPEAENTARMAPVEKIKPTPAIKVEKGNSARTASTPSQKPTLYASIKLSAYKAISRLIKTEKRNVIIPRPPPPAAAAAAAAAEESFPITVPATEINDRANIIKEVHSTIDPTSAQPLQPEQEISRRSESQPVQGKDSEPEKSAQYSVNVDNQKDLSFLSDYLKNSMALLQRFKIQDRILAEHNRILFTHNRAIDTLVRKEKECPTLFWFYPKKLGLRNWFHDPLKYLFQDSLMMMVVCPVTLRLVPCGPLGLGWEVNTPKKWVKKWSPAILFAIYVMQAASLAGRVVGIPLPTFCASGLIDSLGLNNDQLKDGMEQLVEQEQLIQSFAELSKIAEMEVGENNSSMKGLIAKIHQQQRSLQPSMDKKVEIMLPVNMPTHIINESYKSIHTFLTTGENALLGKLEDQLRESMVRVCADDGDIEWVSRDAVELYKEQHRQPVDKVVTLNSTDASVSSSVEQPDSANGLRNTNGSRLRDGKDFLAVEKSTSVEDPLAAAMTSEVINSKCLEVIKPKPRGSQQRSQCLPTPPSLRVKRVSPTTHLETVSGIKNAAMFATTEDLAAFDKKMEDLKRDVRALSFSGNRSSSPGPKAFNTGGKRNLQRIQKRRADTWNTATSSINPRTGRAYTLDDLALEFERQNRETEALKRENKNLAEELQRALEARGEMPVRTQPRVGDAAVAQFMKFCLFKK